MNVFASEFTALPVLGVLAAMNGRHFPRFEYLLKTMASSRQQVPGSVMQRPPCLFGCWGRGWGAGEGTFSFIEEGATSVMNEIMAC